MTAEQQLTIAQQLERAAEIMRSGATDTEKAQTLDRIGAICSYQGRKWAELTLYPFIN